MNFFDNGCDAVNDDIFVGDYKRDIKNEREQDSIFYAFEPINTSTFIFSSSLTNKEDVSDGKISRKRKSKHYFLSNSLIENYTEDELKENNRLRAQRTRKRKTNYYKDLEDRNKQLECQNLELRNVVEEYKRKENQ
jgi:hypothetical protein